MGKLEPEAHVDTSAVPAMDREALAAWRAAGRMVAWRGHSIFVRSEERAGDARLVLIHGFPTASFDWLRLWPALARRASLLAADMLGFGFSAKPRRHRYSLFQQADLITDLIKQAGWADGKPVHLLAHDYGDTVAQELLVRAREGAAGFRLGSVVFLNGGMFFSAINLSPMQIQLRDRQGAILQYLITRRRFRRRFAAVFSPRHQPTRAELDAFFDLVTMGGGRAVLHGLSRYLKERAEHEARWSEAIAAAPVPVALVFGPEDPISGRGIARRFAELAPNTPVIALEGVGHYPQVEAPAAVADAFLTLHRRWGTGIADR